MSCLTITLIYWLSLLPFPPGFVFCLIGIISVLFPGWQCWCRGCWGWQDICCVWIELQVPGKCLLNIGDGDFAVVLKFLWVFG